MFLFKSQMLEASDSTLIFFLLPYFFSYFNVYLWSSLLWRKARKRDLKVL